MSLYTLLIPGPDLGIARESPIITKTSPTAPLLLYTTSIDYTLSAEGDAINIVERLAANDWAFLLDNIFLFCCTEEEAAANTVIKTMALKEKRRFDCHLTISQLRFGLDLVVSLLGSLFR